MSDQPTNTPPLIDYPTTYHFKVMGKHDDDFIEHVRLKFARLMGQELAHDALSLNQKGKFVSVTVAVLLISEEQRKTIYADIHSDKRIVYYL